MKLTWRERLGFPEHPYLVRWIFPLPFGWSLRLHHWHSSDDTRYPHDHTWWFLTFVFWGRYADASPLYHEGKGLGWKYDHLRMFSLRFRSADHRHAVIIPKGETCWTILLTGKKFRGFGFWLNEFKRMKANKYFFTYGHHSPREGELPSRSKKLAEDSSIRGVLPSSARSSVVRADSL